VFAVDDGTTAPTWSWLSVTTLVDFIAINHSTWGDSDSASPSTVVAKCIETHIEHATSDIMGRVSGGYLRLLCHIRPAHNRISHHGSLETYEQFDGGYDGEGKRSVRGSWYCVLAYRESSYVDIAKAGNKDTFLHLEHGYVIGLILEVTKESPRTYRRIGMFTHAWGKGTPDEIAEQYPEFVDVKDPSALERKEVLII
jgi:hypothetical protein